MVGRSRPSLSIMFVNIFSTESERTPSMPLLNASSSSAMMVFGSDDPSMFSLTIEPSF